MITLEKKIKSPLEELLRNYFTRTEIKDFKANYLNDLKRTLSYSGDNKNSIAGENSQLRIEADLLITYAEMKLAKKNLVEFLLSLSQIVITSGEFSLAVDINEKLISETKKSRQYSNIYANAYLSLGEIYSRQAHWQLSLNNIKKAKELFNKQKDFPGKAKCENLLGTIYGEIGDLKKAAKYFESSLSLFENKSDFSLAGTIEINLGIINTIRGDYGQALNYYKRALLNFQKLSNLKRVAEIKHNIGMVYLKLNRLENALSNFDESISLSFKSGFFSILGISYVSKSYLFTLKKDFALAEAFANKAMEICYKTDDKLSIADIYKVKGIIQRSKLNYRTSENYLLTSLRINKELGNKLNFAETCFELGLLSKDMGKGKESRLYFNDAVTYYKSIKALPEVEQILENMN